MYMMKMCVWNKSWTGIDEMWTDFNDDGLPKIHLPLVSFKLTVCVCVIGGLIYVN